MNPSRNSLTAGALVHCVQGIQATSLIWKHFCFEWSLKYIPGAQEFSWRPLFKFWTRNLAGRTVGSKHLQGQVTRVNKHISGKVYKWPSYGLLLSVTLPEKIVVCFKFSITVVFSSLIPLHITEIHLGLRWLKTFFYSLILIWCQYQRLQ